MLGDFLVQTDWQAAHKARPDYWTGPDKPTTTEGIQVARGTSWRANQQHILTYHLTLLVALVPFTGWTWPWGAP